MLICLLKSVVIMKINGLKYMKYKNFNKTLLALAMGAVLTACGGGGTDNTDDSASNASNIVPDVTGPVITLNGSSNVSILINENYQDAGASAADAVDGSLSVTAMGSVDTSTAGNYTIAYSAVDVSGNAANEVTRTVTVIDGIAINVPQTLYGVDYDTVTGFKFDEVRVNASSFSYLEGELLNSAVVFPAPSGDVSYAASAGAWVGRNLLDQDHFPRMGGGRFLQSCYFGRS